MKENGKPAQKKIDQGILKSKENQSDEPQMLSKENVKWFLNNMLNQACQLRNWNFSDTSEILWYSFLKYKFIGWTCFVV